MDSKVITDAAKSLVIPALGYLAKEGTDAVKKYKKNFANSHKTFLTTGNLTDESLKIQVSDVANHGWDRSSNPENFNNVTVAAHGSAT